MHVPVAAAAAQCCTPHGMMSSARPFWAVSVHCSSLNIGRAVCTVRVTRQHVAAWYCCERQAWSASHGRHTDSMLHSISCILCLQTSRAAAACVLAAPRSAHCGELCTVRGSANTAVSGKRALLLG